MQNKTRLIIAAGLCVAALAVAAIFVLGSFGRPRDLAFEAPVAGCTPISSASLGLTAEISEAQGAGVVLRLTRTGSGETVYELPFDFGRCADAALCWGASQDLWVSPVSDHLVRVHRETSGAWTHTVAAQATMYQLGPLPPEMASRLSDRVRLNIGVIE